jgi:hypothetical protein
MVTDIKQIQKRITNITQQIKDTYITAIHSTEEERVQWASVIKVLEKHAIRLASHHPIEKDTQEQEIQLDITAIYPPLVYTSTTTLYATFEHVYIFKKS